jgi:hypothetical protein
VDIIGFLAFHYDNVGVAIVEAAMVVLRNGSRREVLDPVHFDVLGACLGKECFRIRDQFCYVSCDFLTVHL